MSRSLLISFLHVAVACAGLQTLPACDPRDKDSSCPAEPAFAGVAEYDFAGVDSVVALGDFWTVGVGDEDESQRAISLGRDGLGLALGTSGDAPALTSHKYLFFGRVTVEAQAAPGRHLVTSIVLKSASGDEITWDLPGAHEHQARIGYFFSGDAFFAAGTYNYTLDLAAPSSAGPHTYTAEWTDEHLAFFVDGARAEVLYVGDVPPEKWPQTPMQVQLGLWSAGDDTQDDREARFRSVLVEDYMGGCRDVARGHRVEYSYDDAFRGWRDVKVRGCRRRIAPGMITPLASGSAMATATATETETETARATSEPAASGSDASSSFLPVPTTIATRTRGNPSSTASVDTASAVPSATGQPAAPESESKGARGTNTSWLGPVLCLGWLFLFR